MLHIVKKSSTLSLLFIYFIRTISKTYQVSKPKSELNHQIDRHQPTITIAIASNLNMPCLIYHYLFNQNNEVK